MVVLVMWGGRRWREREGGECTSIAVEFFPDLIDLLAEVSFGLVEVIGVLGVLGDYGLKLDEVPEGEGFFDFGKLEEVVEVVEEFGLSEGSGGLLAEDGELGR